MSGQLYDEGTPTTCWDCGAQHAGGKPFHEFTSTVDGKTTIQYRCEECIDYFSRMMWPDEEWGPYPTAPIPPATGRLS